MGVVVEHFLNWVKTARVSERSSAASALARSYVGGHLDFDDRCAAEAALTLLLDDPSPKVRVAMAEALSMSRHAPIQIVAALASDLPEVAALVLARSPLLADSDLVDHVANGAAAIQALVAMRPVLSRGVAAAIAEVGEVEACLALLNNSGASIAPVSVRRICERFREDAKLREALLSDRRLPADCRHMLLVEIGTALSRAPLVVALIGEAKAQKLTRDACAKASVSLLECTPGEDYPALVEHLRLRGDLTQGFMVRVVAHGKIDFFGAALSSLSDQSETRVKALLSGGRDLALSALFSRSGLAKRSCDLILIALKVWREVANGKRVAGVQEVSWLMLRELNAAPGQTGPTESDRELASMIKAIHLDELRRNARGHALAIAAA